MTAYAVTVRLLAVTVDAVNARGGRFGVPVVAGVGYGVGPNHVALPAEVVCDTVVVGVMDVHNLRGDMVIVAYIAARLAADITGESFAP